MISFQFSPVRMMNIEISACPVEENEYRDSLPSPSSSGGSEKNYFVSSDEMNK
jgi:hypothetical protein